MLVENFGVQINWLYFEGRTVMVKATVRSNIWVSYCSCRRTGKRIHASKYSWALTRGAQLTAGPVRWADLLIARRKPRVCWADRRTDGQTLTLTRDRHQPAKVTVPSCKLGNTCSGFSSSEERPNPYSTRIFGVFALD